MKLCLIAWLAVTPLLLWGQDPAAQPNPAAPPSPAQVAPGGTALPLLDGPRTDTLLLSSKYTNSLALFPKAEYGTIAKTFARLLERTHYTRHRFDDPISEKFFDRYLELLDPQRVYFLQSDYDQYVPLRQELDDLTLRHGDTMPAYDIFNRFLQQFDLQYAYVTEYLRTNQFTFDTDDVFVFDRKEAARPRDLAEAQKLWRDRVRSEYLAEKLTAGDRNEMLAQFRTNVATANWDALNRYLTNSFSPEKSTELTQFARAESEALKKSPDATPEALATAVVEKVDQRLAADTHAEIVKKLTRRYNRSMRNLKQFEADEVLQFWLSALGHAYDPHTDYFGPRELEQFSIGMNLSLFGIGATLMSEDGYTVVRTLVPGAPAELSKEIKVNDKIIGVAQGDGEFVDVQDEKLNKVVAQIRGPKGTKVRLKIIPAGADASVRKTVSLVRDEVKLEDSEAKAKLIEFSESGRTNRIGVIDLPSFYANFPVAGRKGSGKTTTGDVAKLLKKLLSEGAEGIVLDLRRNGGGSLEEAINLTGLFIKAGPVVQVRNFDGRVQVDSSPEDAPMYDGPMVVLTSRLSASASEILAAALQDHDRAVIVGDNSTHGKGSVQTVQELAAVVPDVKDPGAAKVTIRKFYRPSGASTQLKGVVPDVVLPSVENQMDIGESSLENALEWDTIAPSKFGKDGEISRLIPDLNKRATTRVSADRDFDYIREDVERYRKAKAEKSVSLNESTRRAEIAENKARAEARKKEQSSRPGPTPTHWEITLKNVDQPGLPAAMTNLVVTNGITFNGTTSVAGDAAAATPATGADDVDDDTSAQRPKIDPHLREAEHVLLDLLQLTSPRKGVATRAD
ncbi:MAG TPA: carboxy terminal-processing peptidase [Verrucomicrobiota bacterium]|nr:carboxy terminal-processing peptidase [Verrucomicrobiota bacterium]